MARAKQTGRSEARRRYRQAAAQPTEDGGEEAGELDYGERKPSGGGKSTAQSGRRESQQPTGRVGFTDAFRRAYRAPHPREDLRSAPELVRNRGFLGAVALLVIVGAVYRVLPNYTGTVALFQLVVVPTVALLPGLVVGFFATRASYIAGLIIGLLQSVVFLVAAGSLASQQSTTGLQIGTDVLVTAFLYGPLTSALAASGAAWYRRFLSLTSGRRPPPTKSAARKSGR